MDYDVHLDTSMTKMTEHDESGEPLDLGAVYEDKVEWLEQVARGSMTPLLLKEYAPRDIVHEVFADLSAGQRTFRSIDSLDAFLRKAVHNKIVHHIRHQRAQKRDARRRASGETIINRFWSVVTGQWRSPSSEAAVREVNKKLESAVRKLPTDDRGMLREQLRGYSHHDIAERRSTTPAAVNGRLFRTKKALMYLLKIDPEK